MSFFREPQFHVRFVNLVLVAFLATAIFGQTNSPDENVDTGGQPDGIAPSFYFEPIAGLTTVRHLAPSLTALPLGTQLDIFLPVDWGLDVTMSGAVVTSRDAEGVSAVCTLDREGLVTIRAVTEASNGGSHTTTCRLDVVSIPVADIVVRATEPWVAPFDLDETATNAQTMDRYLRSESIASFERVSAPGAESDASGPGPRVQGGHRIAKWYRTSTNHFIRMRVDVNHPEFMPLIEWRVNGVATALGEEMTLSFFEPGTKRISVGPTHASGLLNIDIYEVFITSHVSQEDFVEEGDWITFEAATDPPGFEDAITWLSATKYGTASPILGYGATFTVQFNDTWGNDPNIGDFQWLGVRADNAVFNQGGQPNGNAPSFYFEPIAGLTTERHLAPSRTAIPLGTNLSLFLPVDWGVDVTISGAVVTSRDAEGVSAACTLDREGLVTIRAVTEALHGGSYMTTCRLDVVSIPIADVVAKATKPWVAPFDLDETATNSETMDHYFRSESIASFERVSPADVESVSGEPGPRVQNGRVIESWYRTSTNRLIQMRVDVNHPEFLPLMEWRVNDMATSLGEEMGLSFFEPGTKRISVGPTHASGQLNIDIYEVFITSHVSQEDFVEDGDWITFEAATDPPGFEDAITWLSSTTYGTATPVLGYGPTFTVRFNDTWHDDPIFGDLQWLGVRADNTAFNQDQKCPPDCPGCDPPDCNDGNPLTCDTCANQTCSNIFECVSEADCDDADECTDDVCIDGCCEHIPECTSSANCNDGNACTNDACIGGCCRHTPECTTDIDCDDGDPTTFDECLDDCCENTPTGACCSGESCTITTSLLCGGTYRGDDTNCGPPNPCVGCCCLTGGTSTIATADACEAFGGFYVGDGTTCGACTAAIGDGTGCPGETIEVSCVITNNSECEDTFGWMVTPTGGAPIVTPLPMSGSELIGVGQSASFPLPVAIGALSPRGNAQLKLVVQVPGAEACTDSGTVTVPAPMCIAAIGDGTGCPGETISIPCVITNNGQCEETFDWTVTQTGGNPDVMPVPNSGSVTLDVGQSANIPLPVTIGALSPRGNAQLELTVEVGGVQLCISPPGTVTVHGRTCDAEINDTWGLPGQTVQIPCTITNTGKCAENFNWNVTWDSGAPIVTNLPVIGAILLNAGQTTDFSIFVQIDPNSPLGDATLRLAVDGGQSDLCTAFGKLTVIRVDLDIDSNNNGIIEASDDKIEEDSPGKFVFLNNDDDNNNDVSDAKISESPVDGENDTVPILMSVIGSPPNPSMARWSLQWNPSSHIRVWQTEDKLGNVGNGEVFPWPPPTDPYWVEGIELGLTAVTFQVFFDGVHLAGDDTVIATIITVEVSHGILLPDEDEPVPPSSVQQLIAGDFVRLDDAQNTLAGPDETEFQVFIADRAGSGASQDTYVPILAELVGVAPEDAQTFDLTWTGISEEFEEDGKSFASIVLNGVGSITVEALSALLPMGRQQRQGQNQVKLRSVTADPPLTVPGYTGLDVSFAAQGYTFQNGDTFSFQGTGLTVEDIEVTANSISGKVNATAATAIGARTVVFSLPDPKNPGQRKNITIPNAFTVYRGVTQSLVDILDRPAPGPNQQFPGQVGANPRTQAQHTRIQNVVAAGDDGEVIGPWNTWSAQDSSLTIPPTAIDQTQRDVLTAAAAKIEANTNKLVIGVQTDPQPPDIPVAMLRDFLTFLVGVESSGNLLAMAGIQSENSYGIVQFNDVRADGNNFTGGTGQLVPIFRAGIQADWKQYMQAATTEAELKTRVENLGDDGSANWDWRADPYASLVNAIRNSQAFYGRLMIAPGGTTIYVAGDDFRADQIPPTRAYGEGSQRDCFELFAVVHRLASDVFGGTFGAPPVAYEGGLLTAPTPNEWHTTGTHTNGKPFMTDDGTTRAEAARAHYNTNAPKGGYQ